MAKEGHAEAIKVLLDAGADPNAREKALLLMTPLHWAALKGDAAAIRTLLDASADPNAQSEDSETPLDIARKNGHAEAVRLLEEAAR